MLLQRSRLLTSHRTARHWPLLAWDPAQGALVKRQSIRHNSYDVSCSAIRSADEHQVVVVGGGAAGLTAAYFAAKAGAQVLVLERTREAGKKVLMSGGTRCNVLPLEVDLSTDYFTDSSHSALRAVFSSWTLGACKDWLCDEVGLSLLLEEDTAKWFPASNSSREVRDKLVAACRCLGVVFRYNASVEALQQQQAVQQPPAGGDPLPPAGSAAPSRHHTGWRLTLSSGQQVAAERVVLATGGLSFPAVGTDGTGHRLLQRLGHSLRPAYPALTPLKGRHPGGEQLAGLSLAGVMLEAWPPGSKAKRPAAVAQRGGFLFTHRGFSGPSVLDVSHVAVQAMQAVQHGAVQSRPAAAAASGVGPVAASNGAHARTAPQQQAAGEPGPGKHRVTPPALPSLKINWVGKSAEEWEALLQQSRPSTPAADMTSSSDAGRWAREGRSSSSRGLRGRNGSRREQQQQQQQQKSAGASGGGLVASGRMQVSSILHRAGLPERLAAALVTELGLEGRVLAQLKKSEREALVGALVAWTLPLSGHEGYKKAEVTGGGVPLEQVDCKSLESRVRGLGLGAVES